MISPQARQVDLPQGKEPKAETVVTDGRAAPVSEIKGFTVYLQLAWDLKGCADQRAAYLYLLCAGIKCMHTTMPSQFFI